MKKRRIFIEIYGFVPEKCSFEITNLVEAETLEH